MPRLYNGAATQLFEDIFHFFLLSDFSDAFTVEVSPVALDNNKCWFLLKWQDVDKDQARPGRYILPVSLLLRQNYIIQMLLFSLVNLYREVPYEGCDSTK
jgi:hypothetical protein